MKTTFLMAFCVIAAASACAPAPAPAPPKPDEAAIRTAISAELAKFTGLVRSKNAEGVAALFTDDGTWILPDASTYKGHADIEKGAKAFFDMIDTVEPGETVLDKVVVVSDNEAVSFAHGTMLLKMKGEKKAQTHVNPFADHWKKGADGVWKVTYEVNAEGVMPEAKKD